jgi:murein DD-endopeptidase MepM/ murein hydrolase activator NlpD
MTKTPKNVLKPRSRKTAVIAAGLGASMLLGTGSAVAATLSGGQSDVFASDTAALLADSTRAQADQQHKQALAKKQAEQRAKEAKADRSARTAERPAKVEKQAAPKPDPNAWTKPIAGKYQLSAPFGNSGDRWSHKHSGQDFAVPTGTPVNAVFNGTVVKAGPNGGGDGSAYGNAIVIKHPNGAHSQYAHMSKLDVTPGQQVKKGQKIGLSGNSGNSSGPHLHFEIRKTADYGTGEEPLQILRQHGVGGL